MRLAQENLKFCITTLAPIVMQQPLDKLNTAKVILYLAERYKVDPKQFYLETTAGLPWPIPTFEQVMAAFEGK